MSLAVLPTALVAAGLVYLYFFAPQIGAGPEQPIPFSHRLHVTVKEIDCRFCHSGVSHTPQAGIPSAGKCAYCHDHVIPSHPYIRLDLEDDVLQVREAAQTGRAIAWRKVTWLPDHVYFSHPRHVRKDIECDKCHAPREPLDGLTRRGVDCRCCHGAIQTMDRVYEVKRFTMGLCRECHLKGQAPLDCWTCHQ